jgi:hypothetical protein
MLAVRSALVKDRRAEKSSIRQTRYQLVNRGETASPADCMVWTIAAGRPVGPAHDRAAPVPYSLATPVLHNRAAPVLHSRTS